MVRWAAAPHPDSFADETRLNYSADKNQFVSHRGTLDTTLRAIMERGFYVKDSNGNQCPPPKPAPAAFDRLIYIRNAITRRVKLRPRMQLADCVQLWTGPQRKVYENALDKVLLEGWNPRWSHVKTFVKREKKNLKSKPDPVPRMIQPRDPCYNLLLASYLKHNEHNYYKALDEYVNGITGMKTSSLACGVDVVELGAMFKERWASLKDPVAVCIDAKRWDQHCSVDALKFEHKFYTTKCRDQLLRELLKCQLVNKGRAVIRNGKTLEGKIKYTLRGARMSGDMNTSLGNKLLMCTLCINLMLSLDLKPLFVNNGDDMVLLCNKSDLNALRATIAPYFLDFGYQIVIEKEATCIEEITFCQMNPIQHPFGTVMCRDPRVVLSKDHHCIQPALDYQTWLNSVGDAGRRLSTGMPVLEAFYNSIITGDKVYKTLKPFYFAPKNYERAIITDDTRLSFYRAFSIAPQDQINIESWLETTLPHLSDGPERHAEPYQLI